MKNLFFCMVIITASIQFAKANDEPCPDKEQLRIAVKKRRQETKTFNGFSFIDSTTGETWEVSHTGTRADGIKEVIDGIIENGNISYEYVAPRKGYIGPKYGYCIVHFGPTPRDIIFETHMLKYMQRK